MSEKPEISEKPIKKSAIMTEEKKKQLALARAKAEEIAHQNRLVRQKEEQAKELAKQVRAEKAEHALQQVTESAKQLAEAKEAISKPVKKSKQKVVYVDSSSSDSEDEIVYVKRKPPRIHKHKHKHEEEEHELLRANPYRDEPVQQHYPPPDYSELMTNAQLKHEVAMMKREMLKKSMFKC